MRGLIRYNLKIIFSYNAVAAVLLVFMSPLFFRLTDIDPLTLKKMGDLYLSLTGILLYVTLGNLERHYLTWEFVFMRKVPYTLICFGRVAAMMTFHAIVILAPVAYCYFQSTYIDSFSGYADFVAQTWFLGLLGLLISEFFRDYRVAFVVAIAYYFISTAFTRRIVVPSYFTYSNGQSDMKMQLFLCCILMLVLYGIIVKVRCRHGIHD